MFITVAGPICRKEYLLCDIKDSLYNIFADSIVQYDKFELDESDYPGWKHETFGLNFAISSINDRVALYKLMQWSKYRGYDTLDLYERYIRKNFTDNITMVVEDNITIVIHFPQFISERNIYCSIFIQVRSNDKKSNITRFSSYVTKDGYSMEDIAYSNKYDNIISGAFNESKAFQLIIESLSRRIKINDNIINFTLDFIRDIFNNCTTVTESELDDSDNDIKLSLKAIINPEKTENLQ